MSHLLCFLNNNSKIAKSIALEPPEKTKTCKISYFSLDPVPHVKYIDKQGFKNNFYLNPDVFHKLSKPVDEFRKFGWYFQMFDQKLYIVGKTDNGKISLYDDHVFIEILENKNEIINSCF